MVKKPAAMTMTVVVIQSFQPLFASPEVGKPMTLMATMAVVWERVKVD